jgi:hypothetical protein
MSVPTSQEEKTLWLQQPATRWRWMNLCATSYLNCGESLSRNYRTGREPCRNRSFFARPVRIHYTRQRRIVGKRGGFTLAGQDHESPSLLI